MVSYSRKTEPLLPPFEEFEKKFRRAFGREMTREERRFYRLVNMVLQEEETNRTDGSDDAKAS